MLNKIRKMFKKRDAESVLLNTLLADETSYEFTCKCGKQKGWITENKTTQPCPNCGRKYIGYYDHKNLTVENREVDC